jgi:hypothetical protein
VSVGDKDAARTMRRGCEGVYVGMMGEKRGDDEMV